MNDPHGVQNVASEVPGGPWHTIGQVAQILGRHPDTIRRWQRSDKSLKPSKRKSFSGVSYVWLYSAQDIDRLREHMKTIKPGRPRE